MTRRLRVHNGVEDDLFEAFSYYADAAPDQIDRLYNLFVDAVTKRIPQAPNAFAPLFKHYRHIYLRPFRYYVAYRKVLRCLSDDRRGYRHTGCSARNGEPERGRG